MDKQISVVYWSTIPSPYVVDRFNALADRGNVSFEAWFNDAREPDRSWEVDATSWRFRARYVRSGATERNGLQLPLSEIASAKPDVFISGYDRSYFALGSLAARAAAGRVGYRSLPTFESWARRTWWRELCKHYLFRVIDGVETPGPAGALMAHSYGARHDSIHYTTQSVDVDHYMTARMINSQQRELMREQLNLRGCTFIYVGRIWSGKGLDHLFQAYEEVAKRLHRISLLIVGDGVDEARYRKLAEQIPGVVFAGFVQPRELPRYYALADVMVFPTLGDPHGLVVEEAMAAGLPVICSDAAGDIQQRVPQGKVGFVVPVGDVAELEARMSQLAADPLLRLQLASHTAGMVEHLRHDRWAADFEQMVLAMADAPARLTLAAYSARIAGTVLLKLQNCPLLRVTEGTTLGRWST